MLPPFTCKWMIFLKKDIRQVAVEAFKCKIHVVYINKGALIMFYDFDRIYDRTSTLSSKWSVREVFGRDDVLPMWIADMDFCVPQPVVDAMKHRMEHPIFGYTRVNPELYDAIAKRLDSKYGWEIDKEWIVITPGVMPSVHTSVLAFTQPEDSVVVQSPVYPPFWSAVSDNNRKLSVNKLKLSNHMYGMDFEDLSCKFKKGAKMIVLCSPHNPGGRVWTKQELKLLGDIVIDSGGVVISDEIHCELVLQGYSHTPFASISEKFAMSSVTCMAPSKTFNIPGLRTSIAIIPNEELRQKFNRTRGRIMGSPGIFGLIAMEAAFTKGDEWLTQLLQYIKGNVDYAMNYFSNKIPEIKPMRPESTYLLWLDCRNLGLKSGQLKDFFVEKAKVGLNDGATFGPEGEGFMRLNVGCPRRILEEGLQRIETAVTALRQG